MKTYEEMSQIVLARIEEERMPLWKSILLIVLKRLLIGLLTVLIITILIFIAWRMNGWIGCSLPLMD